MIWGYHYFRKHPYERQNGFIFPKVRGENSKHIWVATSQFWPNGSLWKPWSIILHSLEGWFVILLFKLTCQVEQALFAKIRGAFFFQYSTWMIFPTTKKNDTSQGKLLPGCFEIIQSPPPREKNKPLVKWICRSENGHILLWNGLLLRFSPQSPLHVVKS